MLNTKKITWSEIYLINFIKGKLKFEILINPTVLNRNRKTFLILYSGERGIRTLGPAKRTTVFETAPIDRSGISPFCFKITKISICQLTLQIFYFFKAQNSGFKKTKFNKIFFISFGGLNFKI